MRASITSIVVTTAPGEHGAGVEVRLAEHAVERFRERVRPCLSLEDAADALTSLVGTGTIELEAPSWFSERQRQEASAYLSVGDLVLPLAHDWNDDRRLCAVTCVARGGLSDKAREGRNRRRRKQKERRRRQKRREKHGCSNRRRARR